MSGDIIITVIGVVCLLLGLGFRAKGKNIEITKEKSDAGTKAATLILIPLGLVVMAAGIVVYVSTNIDAFSSPLSPDAPSVGAPVPIQPSNPSSNVPPRNDTKPPNVKITAPQDGQQVHSRKIQVEGTARNLKGGQEIWIVRMTEGNPLFYPQVRHISMQPDGRWVYSTVYLGREQDVHSKHIIIVVLADRKAADGFRRYFIQCPPKCGIEQLPEGVVEYDQVRVMRVE
jgi:hypothetical protein